jgi:Co/Zn/Cd efflux system component
MDKGLRRAVLIVALANLGWFFVESAVARRIGSVALFADSVDFLEDAATNLLVFVALTWTPRRRARLGMGLAVLLLAPVIATVWTGILKILAPLPPSPLPLTATALGALVVNVGCALLLVRYRDHQGSVTRAAYLSARNDAVANVAIIAAGVVTMWWASGWPDVVVGACIAVINADAAREVWLRARQEQREAAA